MGVPKRRTPAAKRDQRRSHHAKQAPQLVRCTNCRAMHINHQPCRVCGMYNGREALAQDEPQTT